MYASKIGIYMRAGEQQKKAGKAETRVLSREVVKRRNIKNKDSKVIVNLTNRTIS